MRMRRAVLVAAAMLAGCVHGSPDAPPPAFRAALDQPALAGTRWGLLVVDEDGREVAAVSPDARFLPASNTKLVTVAAAFAQGALLAGAPAGTSVALEPNAGGVPDVVLVGAGDPLLGDGPDCVADCLGELADAVAARTRAVGAVIGDDRLYPDERWGLGWSWEDLAGRYGTAVSALTLADNVTAITVTAGEPPVVASADGWFTIDHRVVSGAQIAITATRLPGSRTVRVTGTIAPGAPPRTILLGIDDPAEWAAYRLARLLRARGVTVAGPVGARHRAIGEPRVAAAPPIAVLTARSHDEGLRETMKASQNLYAELLLRRVAAARGDGGTADGLAAVAAMFAAAGVARGGWDLADGSGMSVYNRLSPRAVVGLLRWTQTQPWGAAYRATLPVGGVDGTLAARFRGTPLEGRVFAKTGTLNGTSALSGFLVGASGRTLTFSSFSNDRPSGAGSAAKAIEDALNAIAAAN